MCCVVPLDACLENDGWFCCRSRSGGGGWLLKAVGFYYPHTHVFFWREFSSFFHKNTTMFSMQLKGGGELICALPVSSGRSYACFFLNKNFRDFFGCMHHSTH